MKLLAMTLMLLGLSPQAMGFCARSANDLPEKVLEEAPIVFIATITTSYLDPNYQELAEAKDLESRPWHRKQYTVRYDFHVSIPIKGDPAAIPYLVTGGVYNDPHSKRFGHLSEQSRFVPGDSLLVVARQPGPVGISWIPECADSMPWDNEARALLKRSGLRLVR